HHRWPQIAHFALQSLCGHHGGRQGRLQSDRRHRFYPAECAAIANARVRVRQEGEEVGVETICVRAKTSFVALKSILLAAAFSGLSVLSPVQAQTNAPSTPADASAEPTKPCFKCNGTGQIKCPFCKDGQVECPGP